MVFNLSLNLKWYITLNRSESMKQNQILFSPHPFSLNTHNAAQLLTVCCVLPLAANAAGPLASAEMRSGISNCTHSDFCHFQIFSLRPQLETERLRTTFSTYAVCHHTVDYIQMVPLYFQVGGMCA